MSYLHKNYKLILMGFLPCAAYNLYFLLLLPEVKASYLLYLDFLIAVGMLLWFAKDKMQYDSRQRRKREALCLDSLIGESFGDGEDAEIMAHDTAILKKQMEEQFAVNCELQDYMARWCHELKIPLAAALLIAEKTEGASVKETLKEQLERMNLLLRSALLGAKIQSSLFDIQIRETTLSKCVRNSIHNNQFFLIRKHFRLEVQNLQVQAEGTPGRQDVLVYTDPSWLTYVLDQLISNAIKYTRPGNREPCLKIYAIEQEGKIRLCVEDDGEGIRENDIRRIFEKGYTGSNYHNGQYKSTGMGLYMVSVILDKLGHGITVGSRYGKGTRFTITFSDNRDYLNVTKM